MTLRFDLKSKRSFYNCQQWQGCGNSFLFYGVSTSCFSSPPQQSIPPPVFRLFCRFSFVGIIIDNVGGDDYRDCRRTYYLGRLILHLPTGPMKISMVVMVIILIILAKTCSTQSAPASSWVTPSPEEDASSPSKFVFLSSGFVEMFSLCQKKSPLKNFSSLVHPSPFLSLVPHVSLS